MKTNIVFASLALAAMSAAAKDDASWNTARFDEKRAPGNYVCTVTFGNDVNATTNWVKAEGRRLMLDKIVTKPGEFVTRKFVVNTRTPALSDGGSVAISRREANHERWDDRLTIDVLTFGADAPMPAVDAADDSVVTIYVAGDSTVCCYNTEPYGTWGQMLPAFFDETVAIANHAESGRSLMSFKKERRRDKVIESAKPGDWLFVQFGHNDQKEKCPFEERMRRYDERLASLIDDFRARGGKVALVSPMERRRFDANGVPFKTLQEYEDALAAMAKAKDCPFINLHDASFTLYTTLGEEKSKALFGWRKNELDNTHHSVYGGYELARAVVQAIKSEIPELAAHLRPGIPDWSPTSPDPDPQIPRTGKTATEKPEEK